MGSKKKADFNRHIGDVRLVNNYSSTLRIQKFCPKI